MEPVWMALAINDETGDILAPVCVARTKEEVEAGAKKNLAKDRLNGYAVLPLNFMEPEVGKKISAWLAEHDILGAENTKVVRDIGVSLDNFLQGIGEAKGWKPKRR